MIPILYTHAQITKHLSKQEYQNGDIVFQSSNSKQCEAIKLATHSNLSHCGILFQDHDDWYVLEAVEPVQVELLSNWIKRDANGHYSVKRLKNASSLLNESTLNKMYALGKKWIGKHYDIYFNWGDDQLYCSELVWKLYHNVANIDICELKPLRTYDLSHSLVKQIMKERYGNEIPLNEHMVAPSDLYNSSKLELIDEQ